MIPPNAKLPPSTMITLFTLPKPFVGHIGMIQRNAIQSWTRLHPDIDILMFGSEQGTAEIAAEFGIRHFPDVDVNEYGTPRMSGYFQQAEEAARHSRMCYVNADIVLFPDLLEAVAKVDLAKFVMGGRRTDYDIEKPIDFSRPDWAEALREDTEQNGTLHDFSGIDYFVYPRGMFGEIPEFALGRWYWDNWLVYRARRLGGALIDASACVTAIHQNHDYRHIVHLESKGESRNQGGIESFGNRLLVQLILMTRHSSRKNECGYDVGDADTDLSREHQRRHAVLVAGLHYCRPEHEARCDVRPSDQQVEATASAPDRIPVEASPASTHFVVRRETRSTTFRAVRGAGMTSAISGNDLLAAIELPRIRQHPPSPSLRPSWRKLTMSPVPPIPAWCDNEAVVSLHQFRSARRGELGDGSTDRRIQRSVAAGAGRPAARSPRDCGIAAAPRDLLPIHTPTVLVPDSALSVVGQTDGVAVIASHYASLSQQRDVRERLVFVKMQPIGSVHLRPRGLDVCTLRGRITRVVRSGAAIRNVAIDPEQRA